MFLVVLVFCHFLCGNVQVEWSGADKRIYWSGLLSLSCDVFKCAAVYTDEVAACDSSVGTMLMIMLVLFSQAFRVKP